MFLRTEGLVIPHISLRGDQRQAGKKANRQSESAVSFLEFCDHAYPLFHLLFGSPIESIKLSHLHLFYCEQTWLIFKNVGVELGLSSRAGLAKTSSRGGAENAETQ
jgi:hypothetical protein